MRQVVDDIVVTKLPAGTRTDDLAARLGVVSSDPVRALFAAPLTAAPLVAPDGRHLILEPRIEFAGDTSPIPWREVGALVARLQACPLPTASALPEHGGRAALTASVMAADRLHPGGGTDVLRELGRTLLRTWPTSTRPVLVHGAVHLRSVGRLGGTPTWLFSRPETLGFGCATWDLGRPAGLWGAGLLDDASWQAFHDGYREAGGAIPAPGVDWDELDHPARCAVYMETVREVARCGEYPRVELTDLAQSLLKTCVRMNGRRWPDLHRTRGWTEPGSSPDPAAHGLLHA